MTRIKHGGSSRTRGTATRILRATVLLASMLVLSAVTQASAASPPFTECPAIGQDTSCETLIVINEEGKLEAFNDPTQQPFDGIEDTLVGVRNESKSNVKSIKLTGSDIFGFDGDGLCAGYEPGPEGCPFGTTGYEGPNTSFEIASANEGEVVFAGEGLAPGESAYFSLEENVNLICEEEVCKQKAPTELSTTLSSEEGSGASITVKPGTAVTDTAQVSGEKAETATGTVEYKIYSDAECTKLFEAAGTGEVKEGKAAASESKSISAPGTYYWQATYSGDEENGSSKSSCGSEVETVSSEGPTSTTLSTSLEGGGQSGEKVTVSEGEGVSDTATLGGEHASEAGGTVTYSIYSDNECTKLAKAAGSVTVTEGKVPPSETVSDLTTGTYYWQAAYGGDEKNEASKSPCGSEVEIVKAKCTSAVGKALFKVGEERQNVSNAVFTDLKHKQKFVFRWEKGAEVLRLTKLTSASCEVQERRSIFKGAGEATLNEEPGYQVKFSIAVTKSHKLTVKVTVRKGKELIGRFFDSALTGEVIS